MRNLHSLIVAVAIVANITFSYAQSNGVDISARNGNEVFVSMEKYKAVYPNEAHGHVYGKEVMQELLAIPSLSKVFVFNGLSGGSEIKLVFKGADQRGEIIMNSLAFDLGYPCPPYCPKTTTGGKDKISAIGSVIEEGLAQQLIINFQDTYRSRAKAQVLDKASVEEILAQETAEGIFFWNAINEKGEQTMVAVGVDANGNSMWDGVIINNATPIPSYRNLTYPSRQVIAKK
jgi:hypothetical protein